MPQWYRYQRGSSSSYWRSSSLFLITWVAEMFHSSFLKGCLTSQEGDLRKAIILCKKDPVYILFLPNYLSKPLIISLLSQKQIYTCKNTALHIVICVYLNWNHRTLTHLWHPNSIYQEILTLIEFYPITLIVHLNGEMVKMDCLIHYQKSEKTWVEIIRPA